MSGHSHAKTIKHKKDLADAQRGKIFSKMGRLVTIAARGGPDPEINPKLREAIDKAKSVNMPASNIERAIKRGAGKTSESELQEVFFEAYGPGNIAIIIDGITDNKNRTISEIKQILNQHNGRLASDGSVKWLFERKGIMIVNLKLQTEDWQKKEDLELVVIEAGAENMILRDDVLEVYTPVSELENAKKKLKEKGIEIESSTLGWAAKEEIEVSQKDKDSLEKLFEALDENDSVQEIYSNLKV